MIKSKVYQRYTESDQAEFEHARIIQQGLLPKSRHFERMFSDFFVMDVPLNIISGDFYWVGVKNGLRYLVVGDCTGHGISAALLSVLAINLFEYSIMNKGIKKTFKILQEVDKKFIESFKNFTTDNFDNPWIDLSIICIDESKQKLYFSSANRKLLYLTGNVSSVYSGNRYPIGGWQVEKNRLFSPQIIDYTPGDLIYLGSDGFQDQIGGPFYKKYKSKQLHDFLIANSHLDLSVQLEALQTEFRAWKGDYPQTDDVCIVGARL